MNEQTDVVGDVDSGVPACAVCEGRGHYKHAQDQASSLHDCDTSLPSHYTRYTRYAPSYDTCEYCAGTGKTFMFTRPLSPHSISF